MGCVFIKQVKVLFLLGSARKKSINTGLVRELQKCRINQRHHIQLSVLTLDQIPIYNEDEQNKIKNGALNLQVLSLRNHAEQASAIIFVTPQINGSISPLILNAFLWLSKSYHPKVLPPLLSKKGAVISASFLSQNQIIDCLQIGKNLKMIFFSETFHLELGNKPVNSEGKLVSLTELGRLREWYKKFIQFVQSK